MLVHAPAWAMFTGILPAVTRVLAGQVPTYNSVIGGRPDPATRARLKSGVLAATDGTAGVNTTPGKLRVVENSGVCETTPEVYQASGYGDLTDTESLW